MKPKLEDGICHLCDKDSDDLEDGICQRCIRKREADIDEEIMDRADLKRTSGRNGSEDEGW